MVHRRFPQLRIFTRPRAARNARQARPGDTSAACPSASWADTFRRENADLVGRPPPVSPRRYHWLVAASIFGLVMVGATLRIDLLRSAPGPTRDRDADQRRAAIAEAVARDLARTREELEASRAQATRELSTMRKALAARETALRQAEQARQAADALATERTRTVETMASDLARARREAEGGQAAIAEARAAEAIVRTELAVSEESSRARQPEPRLMPARPSEAIPAKADGGAGPLGAPVLDRGSPEAGEGLRFGRETMAWLPLVETGFMALDLGTAVPDAAQGSTDVKVPPSLDGLPAPARAAPPDANGKGALGKGALGKGALGKGAPGKGAPGKGALGNSLRPSGADAGATGPSRTRQRAGVKSQPPRAKGTGARQRRLPRAASDVPSEWRSAAPPDRS